MRSGIVCSLVALVATAGTAHADFILSWDGPAVVEQGVPFQATLQVTLSGENYLYSGGSSIHISPPSSGIDFFVTPGPWFRAGPSGPNWLSFISNDPAGVSNGTFGLITLEITPFEQLEGIVTLNQDLGNPFHLFTGECPEVVTVPIYRYTVVPTPAGATLLGLAAFGVLGRRRR